MNIINIKKNSKEKKRIIEFNFLCILFLFISVAILDFINIESYFSFSLPLNIRKFITYFLFMLNIIIILLDTKKGFKFYFYLLLTQASIPLFTFGGFASIYTLSIAVFDLVDILLILLIVKRTIDNRFKIRIFVSKISNYVIFLFLFVLFFSFRGVLYHNNFRFWLRDFQSYIYLFGIYYLIINIKFKKKEIINFYWFIVFVLSSRVLVNVLKYLFEIGRPYGATIRTIFGGEPYLYFLPFLTFIYLIFNNFKFKKKTDCLYTYLILFSIVFIWIANTSRSLWLVFMVIFFLSVIVLLYEKGGYFRKGILNNTSKIIFILIITFCLIIVFIPKMDDYLGYLAKTLMGEIHSSSIETRKLEFKNIWVEVMKKNNFLLGKGLGGGWKDKYFPLSKNEIKAQNNDEAVGGFKKKSSYRETHFPVSYYMLKFGVLGVVIYYVIWGIILYNIYCIYLENQDYYYRIHIFSVFLTMCSLFATRFIKSIIFIGLFLGLIEQLVFLKNKKWGKEI